MKANFRSSSLWWIVIACLACPTAASAAPRYAPGEVLVGFRRGVSAADRSNIHSLINGSPIKRYEELNLEHIRLLDGDVEAAVMRLRNHPLVEYAEPNYEIRSCAVPNDPLFGNLWALRNIGQAGGLPLADVRAVPTWDITTGDSTIKIGVLDTGINLAHEDIVANLWTNPGEIPGNLEDDDNNDYLDDVHGFNFTNETGHPGMIDGYEGVPPNDDCASMGAHGSHVAGIIGARGDNNTGVVGVAWKVDLVAIKILTNCSIMGAGGSFVDRAIAGIEYSRRIGCKVTNNSWFIVGGAYSQALYNAIDSATTVSGQLFVAAAGNDNLNNDLVPVYPASYNLPRIVSVAATDRSDALGYTIPSFASNYGPMSVDLAAPGWGVLSLGFGSSYTEKSGTSMAAPHVAGTLALIYSQYPTMSPDAAKARLLAAVDVKSSLQGKVVTNGRLNTYKAVTGSTDGSSPAAVADLTAVFGRTTARVGWTAPGDDGSTGTAAAFDLRVSNSPITESNFYSGTSVATGLPGPPGTQHCATLAQLVPCSGYYVAIKTRDEAYNWSALSNLASGSTLCSCDVEGDCIPPAAVAGLYADLVSDTEVWLVWTAPGDDGNDGTAVEYDLRYAPSPITEATFENATRACDAPAPWPAGTPQEHALVGLMPCTGYWFAIKTRDDAGNWSALSDVAQATTLCGWGGGGGFSAQRAGAPEAREGSNSGEGASGPSAEAQVEDVRAPAPDWGTGRERRPHPRVAGTVMLGVDPLGPVKTVGGTLAGEMRFEGNSAVWSVYFLGSGEAVELAGIDSASIVCQVPGTEEGWLTRARLRPGEGSTRFGIRSASGPRRFVFLGQFGLEFAPRAVQADAAGAAQSLEVVSARHSTLGDVAGAVHTAGGYDLGLSPGDTLTLVYAQAAERSEGAQDWFLLVSQSGSVTGTAGARSIGLGEKVELPTAFALRQNHPNPFSGGTSIQFELPVEATVRLEVFDAQGRLIRNLADAQFPAGLHAVAWDERDSAGRRVGSGVFLYRIQAGSFRDQKKMVLLGR